MDKIGGTLKQLRENAGVSVKSVSEFLVNRGFKANASTIYSWENDNSQPTPGALLAMCEFYKVPDVLSAFGYGFDGDEEIHLNSSEIEMIRKYRSLDEYGSDLVDTVLDKEYERCQEQQDVMDLVARSKRKFSDDEKKQIIELIDRI